MVEYILYGTSGCHLCDKAKDLLLQNSIEFEYIDIVDDSNLLERLAWSIPVLQHKQSRQELNWPFSSIELGFYHAKCSTEPLTAD